MSLTTDQCQTIDELIAFKEKQGSEILSLDRGKFRYSFQPKYLRKLIKNCPILSSLFFESYEVTDLTIIDCKEFKSLKRLSLAQSDKLTDQGLAHLNELKSLASLSLDDCSNITKQCRASGRLNIVRERSLFNLNGEPLIVVH